MDTAVKAKNTEASIWTRVIEREQSHMTADVARTLLQFDFRDEDRRRMRELAAKAREGALTADEREEVANYERVGSFLSLVKVKARKVLQNGSR